jgi:hypothetical protein
MILMNKIQSIRHKEGKSFLTRSRLTLASWLLVTIGLVTIGIHTTGCGIYRFDDVSIPDTIRTIKVNFIENKAPYVNPQLTPRLTDKLRQKIVSQTKLTQTNNDNADWIINCTITNYSFSTSGISQQRESMNRLTITVHITIDKQKDNKTVESDVSRNFEFSAQQSIQQFETNRGDEIIKGLTDDIFNSLFSEW